MLKMMLKIMAVGVTALLVTASPLARAGSFSWGTRNPVGNFDGYADESRQGGATADT